jgi:hypothetical protein
MTIIATEVCKLREDNKRTIAKIIAQDIVHIEGEIEDILSRVEQMRERLTKLKNVDLDNKDSVRDVMNNANVFVNNTQYNVRELLKQY